MRRPGPKEIFAFAVGLLAGGAAAEPPDLTGRWTLIMENLPSGDAAAAPRIPATASSGWGREITITREDGRVTIERHQFAENDMQPPMRYVYVLGGAESRNAVNMGRGPQEQAARAETRGDTLVITSRHGVGTDAAAEVTHVFRVDASGALVVEATRTAGGAMSTTTVLYRRQPPPGPK
jgi:hypothetical protein